VWWAEDWKEDGKEDGKKKGFNFIRGGCLFGLEKESVRGTAKDGGLANKVSLVLRCVLLA